MGSPLGVFLTLRGETIEREKKKTSIFPACKQLYKYFLPLLLLLFSCFFFLFGNKFVTFNSLFHPYDPVAYRLEPLIFREMKGSKPAYIPCKGGKRMHIEFQEKSEELIVKTEEIKKTFFFFFYDFFI